MASRYRFDVDTQVLDVPDWIVYEFVEEKVTPWMSQTMTGCARSPLVCSASDSTTSCRHDAG